MKRVLKIFEFFWRPLQINGAFFVFMFILALPTKFCLHKYSQYSYTFSGTELFFDLYLICIILTLLPKIIRKWVRLLLAVLLYIIALVDMFCYVHFDSVLTPTMLMLFLETNRQEMQEFLDTYLGLDLITSKTGWILLVALLHFLWALISDRVKNWLKRHLPTKSFSTLHFKSMLGGVVFVIFTYSMIKCLPNQIAIYQLMQKSSFEDMKSEFGAGELKPIRLFLPIHRMVFSLYANHLTSKQITHLLKATEEVKVDSCNFRSPQIVLIIGESYNRHRSQLYGYDKPTTPRQLQRMQDSTLIAFTDVVTPWNITNYVFKYFFSTHSVDDGREWRNCPMFPTIFRKAGYHVSFFTNQFLPKADEAILYFSGGFFLNNSQLSEQMFDVRNTQLHSFDDGVLQDYDSQNQHYDHQLTIFHLIGQHVSYQERFPIKSHRKFTPSDYPDKKLSEAQLQINADYDNATLYNDSIVDEIIHRFENENAIVIYMPDHGEECFNDSLNFFGRMHTDIIDYRLAREEFEIPFWVWASEKYRQTHPNEWEAVKRYRYRAYMTDLLPHMLLFLGGIYTKEYRKEYDVLNSAYNEKRPRLLRNSIDYNKLKK